MSAPRGALRAAAWLAVLGLALLAGRGPRPERAPGDERLLPRLLGPVSHLAASSQWIRVQEAIVAGRHEQALARAEAALALDPGATSGWEILAGHQGLVLSSPTREPDPERRLRWLQAGLATTRRGEELARQPEALAHFRGLLLLRAAEDDELPWPGGAPALLEEAAAAFERAAALGDRLSAELAPAAREDARSRRGN